MNNGKLFVAAYAIDKDLSTMAATNTDDEAGWVKLELAKTYFIHKVVIYNRFYTNWYEPEHFCAQSGVNFMQCVDNDNGVDVSVYQEGIKQKSCGTLQLTYGLEQSDQIYTLFCNTKGNALMLTKNLRKRILMCEIAVTTTGEICLC